MANLNLNAAENSNYTNNIVGYEIEALNTDGATGQSITEWQNSRWPVQWGAFNKVSQLKSAIIMKAIWTVGKGYTADATYRPTLNHITGWGKETFLDILFNMVVSMRIGGDAFAEIVRYEDQIVNLKVLDPGSIKIVVDESGLILRYEQTNKVPGKANKKFSPRDIFHLSHNRIADQIHGISDIDVMEKTIKAEENRFDIMATMADHQARPFILWKLKTDDQTVINNFVSKIEKARKLGEDVFVPDDDDAVEFEIITIQPSDFIFQWGQDISNKYYRGVGMPLILFGSAGTTESGGKIEYLGHEQVFEHDQKFIEDQVKAQLGIEIDLYPPVSLLENLQSDENKDAQNALTLQQSDVTAGSGK